MSRKVRETIADRVQRAEVVPVDPMVLMSLGAMTIERAVEEFGYSRTSLQKAIAAGHLPVVQGEIKRTLIPRYALQLYCANRLAFRNTLKQQLVVIGPAASSASPARAKGLGAG